MVRCVENIKKNTIVLSSCQLLEQILRSYISSRMSYSSSESRDSKILYLAKEHNLISELYISLIKFKREAVDIAQNLLSGDEKPEEETNSTCSSGDEEPDSRKKKYEHVFNQIKISKDIEVSYIEEIKLRLEFLKYLYANSTENLTQTQVGILWDALILNAGIEAEHEECFDWILNGLPH